MALKYWFGIDHILEMPLAAITPVLNDLLNKEGGSSSPYPCQQQVMDSASTTDYLRKASIIPNQVSSINDVSVVFFFFLITFRFRTSIVLIKIR